MNGGGEDTDTAMPSKELYQSLKSSVDGVYGAGGELKTSETGHIFLKRPPSHFRPPHVLLRTVPQTGSRFFSSSFDHTVRHMGSGASGQGFKLSSVPETPLVSQPLTAREPGTDILKVCSPCCKPSTL